MTAVLTASRTEAIPPRYHWTVEGFSRALDLGVFEFPERLELIRGEIIENMPLSPLHADTADYFAQCLRAALTRRFRVREEKPIHIAFDGEPTPDITVVGERRHEFGRQHPAPEDVVLLVEISVTTQDYDLGEKALLYSQAGIDDYWVVLPEAGEIVVHREPRSDGYQKVIRVAAEETLSPLAAPEVAFLVRELLGPAVGEAAIGVD